MPISIDKPSKYFNTVTYTGDGTGAKAISGVGFQPDLVWLKTRSTAYHHQLHDRVRGASTGAIYSSLTNAEDSNYPITSFDSDGFTLGNSASLIADSFASQNGNGTTMCSWNWKANGAGVSNTAGTISSTVSANTTSGFSIVTWSGSGTNDQTIGHGLGVAPSFIIHKNRTYGSGAATGHWIVKTKEKINSSGSGSILYLNQTNAYSDNVHGTLIPSGSTLLQVKGGSGSPSDFWVNASGSNYVAYCFAEVKGFSKFGSFSGNGNADGTFVYTGFKPAFIITKITSETGSWFLHDNKRNGYNGANNYVYPNASDAELTTQLLDIVSNGFKMRFAGGANSSGTSIYMAFAESPFTSSKGIPTTAR